MSDTPENPRLAVLEANLTRAREKLVAARVRVAQLEDQEMDLLEAIAAETAVEPEG
jgi:hypothetical protein